MLLFYYNVVKLICETFVFFKRLYSVRLFSSFWPNHIKICFFRNCRINNNDDLCIFYLSFVILDWTSCISFPNLFSYPLKTFFCFFLSFQYQHFSLHWNPNCFGDEIPREPRICPQRLGSQVNTFYQNLFDWSPRKWQFFFKESF